MEVPRVEAKCRLIFDRIAHIELMRTDHHALGADAEEFTLDCINIVRGIQLLGKDCIQDYRKVVGDSSDDPLEDLSSHPVSKHW